MRHFFKKLIMLLMALWSNFYTITLSNKLHHFYDILYTLWIRNFFGDVGRNTMFSYPCSLQGEGQSKIRIGDNTYIQSYCVLGCWIKYGEQHFSPSITIGDNCSIGEYNHITACNKISIGNGLLTGRFVYIGDNAHGRLSWEEAGIPPAQRALISKNEIRIGKNVWIGDKATILGGASIGDNVIIGAGSVVTSYIPSNCLAVGAPAKVVKKL